MSLEREPTWRLADAVDATVAYADIFDFALTESEIHRDLVGMFATPAEVAGAIRNSVRTGVLAREHEYLTFAGREDLWERRISQADDNRRLWPRARAIGAVFAILPFVRLVGVTGSLAANNPASDADIDYLLIASPGRLWFVRALAVGVVRMARQAGIKICPNYLLTTNSLDLPRHDIYTAHELLQMVPLSGSDVYLTLRAQNRWADRFLPNRAGQTLSVPPLGFAAASFKSLSERAFGGAVGSRLDRWESQRKIARFRAVGTEGRFSRDVCEGHFGRHRDYVCREWERRCDRLNLALPSMTGERVHSYSVAITTSGGIS